MNAYADKTHGKLNHPAKSGRTANAFIDQRTEAAVQRMRQGALDASPGVKDLQAISLMQRVGESSVAQLELKKGPSGEDIEVTLIENYMPVFLDDVVGLDQNFYCRTGSDPADWNNQDYFYDGKDGKLILATADMVNAHWDPKYVDFARQGAPSRHLNCEEYAKAGGLGAEKGKYNQADPTTLSDLFSADGKYVVKLSHHWLKVEKTGANAITITQKDAESAVYSKSFTKQGAVDYICNKTPDEGTVYAG
jgi:hypothetical protein